jgi:hypothetical protein
MCQSYLFLKQLILLFLPLLLLLLLLLPSFFFFLIFFFHIYFFFLNPATVHWLAESVAKSPLCGAFHQWQHRINIVSLQYLATCGLDSIFLSRHTALGFGFGLVEFNIFLREKKILILIWVRFFSFFFFSRMGMDSLRIVTQGRKRFIHGRFWVGNSNFGKLFRYTIWPIEK